ncbi:ABC transporter substrate-binding protein [Deinococcus yavapaiensis]|uniref:NitT/TauT family transport system substrate-binding protein n=1 Tax=Deinococcus yavapaiensis KR-236 TaxID=694435 RepID=A0A318SNW2_9DEIO|nr:ABC transporter substrate-binding protein [Deinococcus yavapaiensis]PYE56602.1 NitT/TauT family transport system substrate-binding protein [Deinococcus yavapaiensis KR-236]
MKKILKVTTLLLSAALLGASTTNAQTARVVRIGIFPNVTHAAGLVAIERGLFQKELGNVKLEVREFANGSQINEAFAANAIDFAYVGPGPAMNGFLRGLPIKVIAGAAGGGAVLVSRGDVKIVGGVKGLASKKVAVPTRGSTQDISLRHLLKENGLAPTDFGGNVTIVPIDPANMPAAFASKQVDAALVQEPWGAVLEAQGAKLVLNEKRIWKGGDYTTTVLVGNTKFMDANPEITKDILRGHLAGIAFIKKSNAAAQKSISDEIAAITRQRPDRDVLFKALARTKVTWEIDLKTLAEYAQLNKEAGFARDIPDLDKFVDLSLIRSLVK